MAMKTLFLILLLAVAGISGVARAIRPWTEEEMRRASDLIVIGTVAAVKDLPEINTNLWPDCKYRGAEATFNVSKVIKGNYTNQSVTLHFYHIEPRNSYPPNSPWGLHFTPDKTNRFLLYLVEDGPSRFAPVSGQRDPDVDAIRKVPRKERPEDQRIDQP
jgi:hypothetical protein